MKTLFKKSVLVFVIISLFANFYFFKPTDVYAIPVFDAANAALKKLDIVERITRWVKDDMFKFLRDQIAFRIMNKVANDTATWIQGGGKPKYVTDWNGFVKDAADLAFDSTIKEVGLARLCQPFSLQVKIGLLPEKRFSDQISCTLDDVVRNINNFYLNFENGGWIAYNESWQPQNNYFGQMILIQDQIQIETSKKVTAATNEAVSGGGFLSQKKCVAKNETIYQQCLFEVHSDGTGNTDEECVQYSCEKWEIITPGDTIGKAAAEAITTDSKWAAGIESWMSLLVNSLINRATKEGLSAISGAGSGNRGSSYGGSSGSITNLVDNQLIQEQQMMIKDLQKFSGEWQYYLNTKNRSLNYAQQQLVILDQINNNNCQPPASESEISAVQASIAQLQSDIADLQSKINEANSLISDLNAANSTASLLGLQQTYVGFLNNYNTLEFQTALVDGSGRAAADAEANQFRNNLQDAQNRLNLCINIGA